MDFVYKVGDIIVFTNNGTINDVKKGDVFIVLKVATEEYYPYKLKDLTSIRAGRCCGWKKNYIEDNTCLYE